MCVWWGGGDDALGVRVCAAVATRSNTPKKKPTKTKKQLPGRRVAGRVQGRGLQRRLLLRRRQLVGQQRRVRERRHRHRV